MGIGLQKLSVGRKLIRTYYYNVPVDQNEAPEKYKNQQKFFQMLDRVPYMETTLGKLVQRERTNTCSKCHNKDFIIFRTEKGIDVNIATDMLIMGFKNLYDTAILISGDGDFDKAIKGVKDMGKHVENAYFKLGHSRQLMKICDKFIELDADYLKGCWQ
ncbi:MAG: NYN domain-containing protein [Deltaproteobacteria bacterium]|nr:NYN domain-containing protein [Deltaproteobacteria bacterium]